MNAEITKANTILKGIICGVYNITPDNLISNKRHARYVDARKTFACIMKQVFADATFERIGDYLNRTHASVIGLIKSHKWDYQYINEYAKLYDRVYNLFMAEYVETVKIGDDVHVRMRKFDDKTAKRSAILVSKIEKLEDENNKLKKENKELKNKLLIIKESIYETNVFSPR